MTNYHINDQQKLFEEFAHNKNSKISNKLIEYLYKDLNTLSEEISTSKQGKSIACEQGCSYCCYTKVQVTQPEAIFIYTQIK